MTETTGTVDLQAKPYCDPEKRHDFVILFDVTDGNPNGDPDAGNLPRTDPETLQGLVTDVALKRKVRNFVELVADDQPDPARFKIYVKHRGILNRLHKEAYRALNIPLSEPGEIQVADFDLVEFFSANQFEGFTLAPIPGEGEKYKLIYSGELEKEDLTSVLDTIGQENSKAKTFAKKVSGKATQRKPSREQVDDASEWMCQNFYDVRMFGAVMSTKPYNAGQVRGPIQMTFSRSVDPILPQDISITRVAITKEEDKDKKTTEMGRKTLIPYGLYVGHGYFSPHLAKQRGVTVEDLSLFWDALEHMWAFDRSASRGLASAQAGYVFTHDSKLGNAPAHKLFETVAPKLKGDVKSPRKFSDYTVSAPEDGPLKDFPGVTVKRIF